MAAWPKISRGGGIFEKFSARGGIPKIPPYPPYSRCLLMSNIFCRFLFQKCFLNDHVLIYYPFNISMSLSLFPESIEWLIVNEKIEAVDRLVTDIALTNVTLLSSDMTSSLRVRTVPLESGNGNGWGTGL